MADLDELADSPVDTSPHPNVRGDAVPIGDILTAGRAATANRALELLAKLRGI